MERCLFLAKNGLGLTRTNPLTGCLILHKNKIISEGWHKKKGYSHAERIAINKVKSKEILKECIIYTNLEPCYHYGTTPPCVDLIIKYKIPKVVIGTKDPFNKVNGKSITKLLENGKEVITGILEDKCKELNKRFFNFHIKKRPYIILKWAETKNKIISKENKSLKISNKYSQIINHKWRSEEQGILVGTNTVVVDNPSLNTRNFFGKNPIRIVIDKEMILDENSNIFINGQKTIIFNSKKSLTKNNLIYEKIKFSKNTNQQILKKLYDKNILSLIVEGGKKTIETFIKNNLWDEARIFVSNKSAKSGIKSPSLKNHQKINSIQIFDDKIVLYKNKSSYL